MTATATERIDMSTTMLVRPVNGHDHVTGPSDAPITLAAAASAASAAMRACGCNQRALDMDDLIRYAYELELDTERFTYELRTQVHARRVSDDFRHGVRSGVNGTPAFFVNGERYDAAWTERESFLRELRAAAGS